MSAQNDQSKQNQPQVKPDDDWKQKQSQTGNSQGSPGAGSQKPGNMPDQEKGTEGNRPQRDDDERSAKDDKSGGMSEDDADDERNKSSR